jgi:hypothetical protein
VDEVEEEINALSAELAAIRVDAEDGFYAAVGKGITAWSKTEGSLIYIALMLLDTSSEKVGVIFYSIPNFYSWLTIIDELFSLDEKFASQKPNWGKIVERLKRLNDTRVRLAHHALASAEGLEVFPSLKPNKFDKRSKSVRWSPLTIDEITEFIEEVAAVMERLLQLIDEMKPVYLAPKKALLEKIRQLRSSTGPQGEQ